MSSVVVEDALNGNVSDDVKAELAPKLKKEPKLTGKFAGKSAEEMVNLYLEQEKELGRKNSEVGELRQLSDSFLQAEIARKEEHNRTQNATVEEKPDFYDDPELAVKSAIENNATLKELKKSQAQQQQQANLARLKQEFPDFDEVVKDPKFQEYAQGSVTRKKMYAEADNYDIESAKELITGFKGTVSKVNNQKAKALVEAKRKLALKKGATQTRSSQGATGGKKTFRRADLIRLKQTDPNKYDAMQDEIYQAYAEGRVK